MDFKYLYDYQTRRGVEVAAAGGHPVLFVGPQGSGLTTWVEHLAELYEAVHHKTCLKLDEMPSLERLWRSKIKEAFGSGGMVAAAYPLCRCGRMGMADAECTCTTPEIKRWLKQVDDIRMFPWIVLRLSGRVDSADRERSRKGGFESTEDILARIREGLAKGKETYSPDESAEKLLCNWMRICSRSERDRENVIKLASTIRRIDNWEKDNGKLNPAHVAEAIQYMKLTGDPWL